MSKVKLDLLTESTICAIEVQPGQIASVFEDAATGETTVTCKPGETITHHTVFNSSYDEAAQSSYLVAGTVSEVKTKLGL